MITPLLTRRRELDGSHAVRTTHCVVALMFGLLLSGCAGISSAPTPEVRQAMAPTGKLRVGFLLTPIHGTKDAATGEFKGLAVDLGKELARRTGVPFEPVAYSTVPTLLAGAKAGEWDVTMIGITTERALVLDYTAPYMEVEFAYLVAKGSPIVKLSDVDRPGVRIGVVESGSPDVSLTRTVRNATLVRVPTFAALGGLLRAGSADVLFGVKSGLLTEAEKSVDTRLLDGRSGGESTGMATPKGREGTGAYLRQFVESAKSEGLVKAAIERNALRGVVVAPMQ